jgi:hypothetical protein
MILRVVGGNDLTSAVIKQRKSAIVIFRLTSHTKSSCLDVVEYDTDKLTKGSRV